MSHGATVLDFAAAAPFFSAKLGSNNSGGPLYPDLPPLIPPLPYPPLAGALY